MLLLLAAGACPLVPARAAGVESRALEIPKRVSPAAASARDRLVPVVRADLSRLFSRASLPPFVAGGALAAASLAFEDPNRIERALDHGALDAGADFGNAYGAATTVAAGSLALMAAGRLARDPRLARTGSELARSLLYTGAIVLPLKLAVDRTRPNGGPYSFPSGHSAVAFAAAPVLGAEFGPGAAIPAYLAATATALGRMEDRKHYLSDVLFGAAIGVAVGSAVAHSGEPSRSGSRISLGPGPAAVTLRF